MEEFFQKDQQYHRNSRFKKISYCTKSVIEDINIKCVSLSSDTSIIDQNINMMVFFFCQSNKSFNTFGIWDIELLNVNLRVRVFGKNLWSGFVSKFNVSAGHNDVPIVASGKIINDSISNTFIWSSDNNVSNLIHFSVMKCKRIFITNERYSDINILLIRKFKLFVHY